MADIARPFIPWIGSKEKLIPHLWQVFPPNPKLYLEPFGGGGALLLGMQPQISRIDIYNDFNCDLVNLFLCARECTVQLIRELQFPPLHSRAEFDLLREFMKHKELLQKRIAEKPEFPHEIGIFLGYPLEDVDGFITHQGENCKLCGCWKVYGNVEQASRTFANYEKCRVFLCAKLSKGCNILQALKIS